MSSFRFRGISLSDSKRAEAISHTQFYEYKNNWVKLNSWLHTLSIRGELPKLDINDEIDIPDDFNPPEGLIKLYRKKFNKREKSHRELWMKEDLFNFPEIKNIKRKKSNYRKSFFDNRYERESTPGVNVSSAKLLGIKGLDEYDQKVNWVLASTLFCVSTFYENSNDGTFNLVKKLEKRVSK